MFVLKSGSPSTRSAAGPFVPASSSGARITKDPIVQASENHKFPCPSNASPEVAAVLVVVRAIVLSEIPPLFDAFDVKFG